MSFCVHFIPVVDFCVTKAIKLWGVSQRLQTNTTVSMSLSRTCSYRYLGPFLQSYVAVRSSFDIQKKKGGSSLTALSCHHSKPWGGLALYQNVANKKNAKGLCPLYTLTLQRRAPVEMPLVVYIPSTSHSYRYTKAQKAPFHNQRKYPTPIKSFSPSFIPSLLT